MREWVLYVGLMAVVLLVFFRDAGIVGALAGLLVSGPLYLGFGWVLAKFGYQRKSLAEMRTPRAETRSKKKKKKTGSDDDDRPTRSRPAPTSRTSTGINRKKATKRR